MAVGIAVAVGLAVGAGVGTAVGVGDWPGAGTAGAPRPCGEGVPWLNQSVLFSFESDPFPSAPPGALSILDAGGGAAVAVPSTNP
ncbi:MAG: hypothetical protein ACJ778_06405, partial [Chloroflexota bacterium]